MNFLKLHNLQNIYWSRSNQLGLTRNLKLTIFKFLFLFPFFFFSQRVLYYSIGKMIFYRTEAVASRTTHQKISVLGVLYFSKVAAETCRVETCNFIIKALQQRCFLVNFANKKFSRKSSIADVQLNSKYALASSRYW